MIRKCIPHRIAAIALSVLTACLLVYLPSWPKGSDPNTGETTDMKSLPSRRMMQVSLALETLGLLSLLVTILWQHTASVAATNTTENMSYGFVKARVGSVAFALGWAGVALLIVVVVWLIRTAAPIKLLPGPRARELRPPASS